MIPVKAKSFPPRFELPLFKPTGALRLSGRPDTEKHFVVFLEIARALPGMVKVIPKAGGEKYAWDKKITFHLDLEDMAQLSVHLSDLAPIQPLVLYRRGVNQVEKQMSVIPGERRQYVVKAVCRKEEIVFTLLPADVYLLIQGLNSLIEECVWYETRK